MSAEVILMNKNGIAIAADSAVTIGNKTKIYNTADKMYMLSKYAPVGILIYNNSSLMDIQVELILKQYREKLGDKKFDTLDEYAFDFFNFCIEFTKKYAGEKKEIDLINNQSLEQCNFIFQVAKSIANKELAKNTIKTDEELMIFINSKIEEMVEKKNVEIDYEFMNDEYYNNIVVKLDTINIINFLETQYTIKLQEEVKTKLVNKLNQLIRNQKNWNISNYTGIAITGYGEEEIFPGCIQIESIGIINNGIVKIKEEKFYIDFEQNSQIIPLAQTDVMNEFFIGVNEEIDKLYNRKIKEKISTENNQEIKQKIKELVDSIEIEKKEIVNDRIRNIHTSLSFLPRDEMIYMAEGMINLTSFKRRLVLDNYSETVGGPIDIAFISKGDGFIWIKRKKYFDKEMNYVFSENYFKKKGE